MTVETTNPVTGSQPVITRPVDPARRADVLFRVRREEGHEMSSWWPISAFLAVSIAVVSLLSFMPLGQ